MRQEAAGRSREADGGRLGARWLLVCFGGCKCDYK